MTANTRLSTIPSKKLLVTGTRKSGDNKWEPMTEAEYHGWLPDPPKPKFEVGDPVEVTKRDNHFYGIVGIIETVVTSKYGNGIYYDITLPDTIITFGEEWLKKYDPVPADDMFTTDTPERGMGW